jgi:hypothetical protein
MNQKFLDAFNWILNCTNMQLETFVEFVESDPSEILPEYIFAWDAIKALSED